MKVTYSVVVLLAALACSHGYPATKTEGKEEQPDKDVDFVPLEARRPGAEFPPDGVVDVDAGGFFGTPFSGNPFPSLLGSIEALMARMRQQLGQILGRLPERPGDDSAFPELHLPSLGDIDLGKGNTTSVTKVIDGHKVTINETEYKQDGEDGAAFFKVRIIDVHPDSSEEASAEKDAEPVAPPKRDRESTEDTLNNEIPKTKDNEELNFENLETFDETDLVPPHKNSNRRNIDWDNMRSIESIEDNSIDAAPQPIRDLSNDIYVNQLMANRGAATNPDAEVFEMLDGRLSSQYYPHAQPERIMAVNHFAPSQSMKVHTNFPVSDFERIGIPEAMPVFSGNMPFYPPPTFSINEHRYNLPIENMMPFPNDGFFARPRPFPSMKRSPMESSLPHHPNFFMQDFPSEPVIVQPNVPATSGKDQRGATTSKVVLETSSLNDNQNAKSNEKSITMTQPVEKQEKSPASHVQEVPEKDTPIISVKVPST